MKASRPFLNRIVAAFVAILVLPPVLAAQETDLDRLFAELPEAEGRSLQRIERQIYTEWSRSGSAAADLLLQRGRDALSAGDTALAIEHLTALIDHAPDFAEGWNARATAYFQAGQYGPAVADIAQVLRLNPRHFGAMTGFARILEDSGRENEALALYEAVLAIHPRLDGVRDAADRLRVKASGQDV